MPGEGDLEGRGLALRTRLRVAAGIGLAAAGLVFLVDAHSRPAGDLPALATVYGVHMAIVGTGFAGSFLALAGPHVERLVMLLVLGYVGNAFVYLHLYRITREALTNVVRHAHAQRVRVEMAAANGELRLAIEDDGVGVTMAEGRDPRGGTGLVGIRERVRALGGTVAVHSGRGVRLDIRLPLRAAS